MNLYKKNLKKLTEAGAYYPSLEHDACGVGLVASTEGKKSRKIVEFGIQAYFQICNFSSKIFNQYFSELGFSPTV